VFTSTSKNGTGETSICSLTSPNHNYSIWSYLASDIHFLPGTLLRDRIFGLFRRANLYGLPRVTVFVSGSEIDTSEYSVYALTIPSSFTQFGFI